jgi:gamma-glutamyltranspeptidase/glutathione hydrolase
LPPAPEGASGWTDKKPVAARRFLAATANPHATDAAYAMLARGGSAVDAAVAAQLVLGLTEPQSSGLGGGAFVLVHSARTHKLHAYDGRETAPAAAKPDRFLDADGAPRAFRDVVATGPAVGVPGRCACSSSRTRSTASFRGATCSRRPSRSPRPGSTFRRVSRGRSPATRTSRAIHARRSTSSAPTASRSSRGSTLRNPAYAATLRTIAREGAGALYRGAIADDIVATVAANATRPGDLTLADLAGYRAIERAPLCGMYRRYRVCGFPPPSSGRRPCSRSSASSSPTTSRRWARTRSGACIS